MRLRKSTPMTADPIDLATLMARNRQISAKLEEVMRDIERLAEENRRLLQEIQPRLFRADGADPAPQNNAERRGAE